MSCIAIIPARGGSKRIPRKNIKHFLGKPIIAYSIEAALTSNCFDEVMVSTDDIEIAEVAKAYGAIVPFLRSKGTADDHATTAAVVSEVLRDYEINFRRSFNAFSCIYPTAPFVTAAKLKEAYSYLTKDSVKSVVPVVGFSFPIMRSFKIENDRLFFNWPEYNLIRSQDIPPAYHDSGQFYFVKTASFNEEGIFFTDSTVPIILDELHAQDIDNESDWQIAEMKYRIINDL
ncbi:pseudaminic acid cytidylyltransferase [Terrimonas sp. NA20]|uniref:Pseudaminic acid cytidylyltransferase n=1 Tax=Terrimonas ginsenosidimutans TaxID=2908004 RepID=A0ABS9KUT0_9BACT|nr:pseudaminic acid cytidylyltransferase [Terrimonas ginsenosidimutans]MCG2616073.1 pseudaminic acid cytidylyltransferase [Terrimonas ginsenosidimutans]